MTKSTKIVGLKDMHPMQVDALLELVNISMNLATMSEDIEIINDVEAYCDELIKLFGGNGVKLTVEVDLNHDGSQSVH